MSPNNSLSLGKLLYMRKFYVTSCLKNSEFLNKAVQAFQ